MSGAKTHCRSFGIENSIGRGAFLKGRSSTVRSCGLLRRENAGMSSERKVGILPAEYLRFPE
ncbi:hypothetical protein DXD07_10565 [Ruminococcus sp. TF10-6]|nr:hypothetical protein DXD07_10565 [Ruminococcus sp. TF10-6]